MSIITVEDICFKYPESKKKTLNKVSFSIEKGSYTAIVGKNGSGKSTLSKIICGLLQQDSGTVTVAGQTQVGLVFQSPKDQIVSGIVSRDTSFGPKNLGLSNAEVELRTIESLNIVEMLHKASSGTFSLSLGQIQKIALSGMIALWSEVLILDEAVSMLDPDSRKEIYAFLRYWHKCGNTIIHITHDKDAVMEAENVIVMSEGSMIFYGRCSSFLKNSELTHLVFGNGLPEKLSDKNNSTDGKIIEHEETIVFEDINFSYDSQNSATLENINFSLRKGELTALTGFSGSGKSTIMEVGCGLLQPSSGKVLCTQKPVLVQQNSSSALFEKIAADDVAFGPLNKGIHGKELVEIVKTSMDDAGVPFELFGERRTQELSGGEQRRLAIAGILAMQSDIIFFDEPTAGLDGDSREKVMNLLQNLARQGKTVMFSTHKRDEAEFSDREIKIENGRIIYDSAADTSGCLNGKKSVGKDECKDSFTELKPDSYANTLKTLRTLEKSLSSHNLKSKNGFAKVHPAVRILIFLALFSASLVLRYLPVCIGFLALSFIYCKFADFSIKKLLSAFLKLLPFLLIFTISQLVFLQPVEGERLFTTWKWFTISPSKLIFCLTSILRTYTSLACISAFFVSTPEYDLIDGLKVLLSPLSRIKIPVRYFILIIEIVFRFIPLLIEETILILKTQIIRGGFGNAEADGQKTGVIKKIKNFIPLIVPLIIQTIKRSEKLADAITMRCF